MLIYNTPSIKDHNNFPNISIKGMCNYSVKYDSGFTLPKPSDWIFTRKQNLTIDNLIDETNSACIIIYKDGKILYERYGTGYDSTDQLTVFSASKPILSFLLQKAIEEGFIKGEDQHVSDFLPFMRKIGGEELKIGHLLNMTSGLNHDEYGRIFQTLITYYHTDLDKVIRKSNFEYLPGKVFVYKSIDYQILGRCLEIATHKSIEVYLKDKLWGDIGKYDLVLTRDSKKGNERMFGGIAMVPMDFVAFGSMFLKDGLSKYSLDDAYIDRIQKRVVDAPWWGYKNGWWRDAYSLTNVELDNDFFASGFGGQCMVVNPKLNTMALRLGTNKGGVVWHTSLSKLIYLINDKATRERKYITEGIYTAANNKSRVFDIRKIKENMWRLRVYENGRKIRAVKLNIYDDTTVYNSMELDKIYIGSNEKVYYDNGKTIIEELVILERN
ncbi:beta-lactamase family protein [Dyadobacter chenwenxiniae]|uniref:Beta-lactamase family protein n=1 Tax=Dyadobacter chenwenxiniae TaxID=2906456 RepID=A0A9X1TEZ4_9BACT|nr:serine hydrolase domain-containing protein [Dyadobacter chenwenxiniae]MCF0062562.1 beta-lactamase family protein [Dyadobacter chenwenxiniae]UON83694.1 beta-lactamase family protein [Dyadobacter chenwenxiniae]